jgi:Arc/MetJ-type ribon-helix-helix transcriptional regulator
MSTSAISINGQEGFYSNRTDFIRTAIRSQLERHADVVKQSTVRKRWISV